MGVFKKKNNLFMKVSVALCTYNGQAFLHQQLQSIFSQTTPVDEVIVCDEGSADDTVSIINSFKQAYPGIIELHINKTKLGVVENFEKAVTLCKGDVIFLSDQDDVWRKDKVEKCVQFFKDHNEIYAVFSDASLIDDNSKSYGKTVWEIFQFKEVADKKPKVDLYEHIISHSNVVTGACLAIRKEAVKLCTPFLKIKHMLHDEWIALKLSQLNRIHFLNDTLISYRLHASQASNAIRIKDRVEANAEKRAVILGEPQVKGLACYKYWKRRLHSLETLMDEGLVIEKRVLEKINRERKKGLLEYYSTLNSFNRKKALFHHWIKRRENISFSDILFS
jgi:glycosyltransferase involved in cell wall biosynthesis